LPARAADGSRANETKSNRTTVGTHETERRALHRGRMRQGTRLGPGGLPGTELQQQGLWESYCRGRGHCPCQACMQSAATKSPTVGLHSSSLRAPRVTGQEAYWPGRCRERPLGDSKLRRCVDSNPHDCCPHTAQLYSKSPTKTAKHSDSAMMFITDRLIGRFICGGGGGGGGSFCTSRTRAIAAPAPQPGYEVIRATRQPEGPSLTCAIAMRAWDES